MVPWKTAHELGHGLGVDDPAGGKWLEKDPPNNKIKSEHIEEILKNAPADIKKKINDCCGTKYAMLRPRRRPDGQYV